MAKLYSYSPLDVGRGIIRFAITYTGGRREVALVTTEGEARRIVACLNACDGIPTDVLDEMPNGQLDREHCAAIDHARES